MIMNLKDSIKKNRLILSSARIVYDLIPAKYKLGKRYRRVYKETTQLLEESQYWSLEQHEIYQFKQLLKLLEHAYNTVPYYNKLFKKHDIQVNNIKSYEDFLKIPYLTKEIIKENMNDLVSKNYNINKLKLVTTGGSTGTPLGFYVDKKIDAARELAFVDSIYKRVGYKSNLKTVIIRGGVIENLNNNKNQFTKKTPFKNELLASSYHLNMKNIHHYVGDIKKFDPLAIKAYPSSLALLANYIIENEINGFQDVRWVILSSESIFKDQKKMFNKAFPNAKIVCIYGHTEHSTLAGTCELSNSYHLQSEYGYSELINTDNAPVSMDNERGEIIATGFNNYAMPFIRYKTADIAINSLKECDCGRKYKILKDIEGRKQDIIITKDDTAIALTSILHGQHLNEFSKIAQYQIIQNEKGVIIFKYVPHKDFEESHLLIIKDKLEKAANNNLIVIFRAVDEISKTRRGKHKFLIQNITKNNG